MDGRFFYQVCEFVGESTGIEAGVGSPSIRFRNGGYCTGHQADFLRQQSPCSEFCILALFCYSYQPGMAGTYVMYRSGGPHPLI